MNVKDSIKGFLNRLAIREDLANHAVYGTLLYWAGSWIAPVVGLTIAVVIGVAKEFLIDRKMGMGQFDPKDVIWTVLLPVLLFIQDAGVLQWIQ